MATFEIEANGRTYEIEAPDQASALKAFQSFSGGASAETAPSDNGAMFERFKDAAAPLSPHNQPSLGDTLEAFQTGAHQGMTLGFGDEINAGLQSPFRVMGQMLQGDSADWGKAYGEGLEDTRGYIDERKGKSGNAALIGELLGGVATGGTLAKGGLTLMKPGMSVPGAVVRGAGEGAAYGGVSGFGNSEADNLADRGWDAAEGALWGAGTGGAASGIAAKLAGAGAKAAVPTVDDLKSQARALYEQAEASGVTFGKSEVKQAADDIAAKVLSEGIDPTLHPRATAALKRLQDAGATGMTVKDAQTMRRVIAAAAKDPMNPDEQRIASIMLGKFDDVVSAKAPDLAEARSIYGTAKKGERIETAIELAASKAGQYSGSGFENALRQEFRALHRQIIKGQFKGLTQAEIDTIEKVANGGAVENAMRFVGKFAPTGVVPTMGIGMLADQLTLGGMGALGLAGAGIAGRAGATAMTKGNALKAALLARSGGAPTPKPKLSQKQLAIARALIASGGQLPMQVSPQRQPVPTQ